MTAPAPSPRVTANAPWRAGVGLKAQHCRDILDGRPDVGFFEVHAENYMGAGGPPHRYLEAIRRDYPLSIHGVGLSLGGTQPLDRDHLQRLRTLLDRYQPELFSEHLAWSTHQSHFLNDLLPVPYTIETLQHVCRHIDEAQSRLGRRLLLENPSTYVEFAASTFVEEDFITEVVQRTGCGLLVDINNAYVSAVNHGRDPLTYLAGLPLDTTGEIHLAGFATVDDADGRRLLIDHHGDHIAEAVWDLYAAVLPRTGTAPTLIEWDNDVPSWQILRSEAARADAQRVAGDAAGYTAGARRATSRR